MHHNDACATIDFETRSACDLRACGSWRYSLDPTTEVLCMAYRLPYWEEGRVELWHPAFPAFGILESDNTESLFELFDWIAEGGLVEAHNAWFERGIWTNIMGPTYDWPLIPHRQWRCSAAKAASHALPRALEDAALAMRLKITKDMEGSKVMKKMTKPRKPRKKEVQAWAVKHAGCKKCAGKGKLKVGRAKATPCKVCAGMGWKGYVPKMPLLYHESPEMLNQLWDYCRVDVLAEEALSLALPDLNTQETELYLLDQRMNERGFELDADGISRAMRLIAQEAKRLNAELAEVTGGAVAQATQRARMVSWFETQGVFLENTQAATLDDALRDPKIVGPARRGLQIVRSLGRSSTAKYEAMRNWMCPDQRVHGGLLYHGASTGRWSGAGVQPHNFVRGAIKDIGAAWDAIRAGDVAALQALTDKDGVPIGGVMEVLSQALRGAIIAAQGKALYVADYAAIEARVLMWLAQDEDALEMFRRKEDIYCGMAGQIYQRPINKKDHPTERQLGKAAILGLGYQMGASKFVDSAAAYGVTIDEEFSRGVVEAYRTRFWRVKQMWWDQEAAAIKAATFRGQSVECGYVTWRYEKPFLYCILPSGRRLAYPEPEVRQRATPWGDLKPSLTYKGVNPFNRQWQRQTTYGGMLVENITQAVARDLMADAMLRAEQTGVYEPILSVHDELIAEAPEGKGDVKEFETLMAECPDWAQGCPVEAEGWAGPRYRK
jgi:DNA polymerase bacteriophage-type